MRLLPLLLAGASFAIAIGAQAADQVSGSFTVKGKTTDFHYAYAFWKPRLMQESVLDLYVLLSDVPIPSDALPRTDEALSKIAALVRDDKVHAIELHFDAATDKLFAGEQAAVYHVAIAPARQGESGMMHFAPDKESALGIKSGKVSVDPETESQFGWKVEATFSVAVPPEP